MLSDFGDKCMGYSVGQVVEANVRRTGDDWKQAVVVMIDDNDSEDTFSVLVFGDDHTRWYSKDELRRSLANTACMLQWRLDKEGTPFTRLIGEWKGLEVGAVETVINIPACAHNQRLVLRNAAPKTEAEIVAELRRAVNSGETFTRGKVTSILNGEF